MSTVIAPNSSATFDTNYGAGTIDVRKHVQVQRQTYSCPSWDQLRLHQFSSQIKGEPRALLCLELNDFIHMEVGWGYCLAEFVAGKFSSIKTVERLAASWRPSPAVFF